MIRLSVDAFALLRAFQSGCLAALIDEPFKVYVFSGAEDDYCEEWPRVPFTELAFNELIRRCSDGVWCISERGRKTG